MVPLDSILDAARLRRILPTLSLVVALGSPMAIEADPLPAPPRGPLAISPSVELSGAQRKAAEHCLATSAVDVDYLAAVVDTTEVPGDRSTVRGDAVPYAEALFESWARAGRIDRAEGTAMVLVIALGDRAIAARPGGLWQDAGFETRAIARTIDSSGYARYARAGQPGDALCAVRDAIEAELGRRLGVAPAASSVNEPPPTAGPNPGSKSSPASETPRQATSGASTADSPIQGASTSAPGPFIEGCSSVIAAIIVGGILLVIIGGPVAVAWWLFRKLRRYLTRDQRQAEEEIETWRTKLRAAADRLLALEKQHPLYFAIDTRRYEGETAELDRLAADSVNRSFLLYSRSEELVGHAAALLANGKAEDAWKLLRESKIAWDKGVPADEEDRRRIFVPLETEYRGVATELLDDLQAAYADAVDALDELAAVEAASRDRIERVEEAAAGALAAAVRRAELGLPADELHDALEPLVDRRRQLEATAVTDPIGIADDLEACIASLAALQEKADAGNALLDEVSGPIAELGRSLRDQIEMMRGDGLAVSEPGFDPELRLDRGAQRAERVEALLAMGRDAEAAIEVDRLRRGLDELAGQLQVLRDAPKTLQLSLTSLDSRVAALVRRIPKARKQLEQLSRHHDEASYADEMAALERIEAMLSEFTRWRVGVDAEVGSGHWLAASEDLATGERLTRSAEALIDAVAKRRDELEAARRRARDQVADLERRLGELRQLAGLPGATTIDRRRLDDLSESTRELIERTREDRPNWADLTPRLEADQLEAERLRVALQADCDAAIQAAERAGQLGQELDALRLRVAQEHRDRPRVGEAVEHAAERLAEWRGESHDEIGGRGRLEQLTDIASQVAAAERAFRIEMDVVHEAEQAIAAAESEIRREDGRGHGHGISADCRGARRQLDEARSAASSRRWEDAASLARSARETAREEGRRARDEARRREDEERRRLERIRAEEAAHRRRMALDAVVTTAQVASAVLGSSRSSIGRRGPIFRTPRRTSKPKYGGGSSWKKSPGGGSRW